MAKVAGSPLDRIDLPVEAPEVMHKELASGESGECSAKMRKGALFVRDIQMKRLEGRKRVSWNADVHAKDTQPVCWPDVAGEEALSAAVTALGSLLVHTTAYRGRHGGSSSFR
jgi:predicted ATPase with chaperone activity